MVSPDVSTEGSASASTMDEKEKRFYSRSIPTRHSSSPSQTQSESLSESSEHISSLPQKKTPSARTPTTPSKPPTSSVKRPRNEDDEPTNKKTKKPKPTKEEPKKTNEDKKRVKKPEPLPSPQKSAKKPAVWNPKDEILFLKALAAYCQEGKEFPKNIMTPVYDYIRNHSTLDHEYTNPQLGEKLRRLRNKFVVMGDKVKGGGYSFKTPHDETVYKLSKKIWGKEEDEEESVDEEESEEQPVKEAEVGNGIKGDHTVKKVSQDEEEEAAEDEEEENKKRGDDVEMTQKEKNDEVEEEYAEVATNGKQNLVSSGMRKCVAAKEALATPNVVSNDIINNGVEGNNSVKLIDQLLKENSVMMNGFKDQLSRENKELKREIVKMVREGIHSSGNGKASNSIGFSSEDVVKRISSSRELPSLDVSEARIIEQKWLRQQLVELEVCSGHLALLQEECQKRMEKLRSFVDEDGH